jgi:neutral trehalase
MEALQFPKRKSQINTNIIEKSTEFGLIADVLTEAVEDVLWNPQDGIWYDFDFESGKPRNYFTPSNLVPLWTETFRPENKAEMSARAVKYLYKQNFNVFPGMYVICIIIDKGQQISKQNWSSRNFFQKHIRPFVFGKSYGSTILFRDLLTFNNK